MRPRAIVVLSAGLAVLCLPVGLAGPLQVAPEGARERAARATESASFDDLARRAAEAHREQDLVAAHELYRQALDARPDWTEGRFALGTVLYDLDRYEEARTAFRRVAAEEPESGAAWAFRGLCEYQLRNYERALSDIQKGRAMGLGSNADLHAVANYHAAILLNRFGEFEVAYEVLKDFALRDQDSPGVIDAFGLSVLRLPYLPSESPPERREQILMAGRAGFQLVKGRRSTTARLAFEELVSRYPEDPNTHYAYGAFLMLDDPDRAIQEFRRVLDMHASHVPAMLQIALQMIKEGRYEDALPYAEKAVQTDPQLFAARNALGRALLELGEVDRAVTELKIGAELAPDSPQMYFHLARAYQRAGRKEDADKARVMFMKLDKERRAERSRMQAAGAPASPDEPGSLDGAEPPRE